MNASLFFIIVLGHAPAACLVDSKIAYNPSTTDISMLENAVEDFQHVIERELPNPLRLSISIDHLNPKVNADIVRDKNDLHIKIFGGMINHAKMSPETLQLLLCHEAGHFFGGPPLKSRNGWSSTEGQADYYSGLRCAHLFGFNETSFIQSSFDLTSIYAEVSMDLKPQIEQCDETIVSRTNFGYPRAQCRFDTLLAGWRGVERPRCWFSH